ncbi:hypothetical protein QTO34_008740 [Cnephaeus nilssonii]|uniref:DUF4795 domain-containing protein n=1 Tax=Cnephaeus nilssonii TaxID=3371016 RepID=A0AA40HGI4_CNENI|nr:hypothetical protein QTO34_008740 [Eptesicus nilssonii]
MGKAVPETGKAKPETAKPLLGTAMPMPGLVSPAPGVAPPTPGMAMAAPGMAKLMPEKARGLMKLWKEGPQVMEMLQNVMEDVKILKEAQERAQEAPEFSPMELLQRVEEVEKIVRNREEFLEPFSRKMTMLPPGEEVTMVTWEELEQAITDGWKASQGIETTPAILKRKGKTPVSHEPSASATSIGYPSADQALDSAGGFGPDQTLLGPGGPRHPSEGFLDREPHHPRVRDEAGLAKPHHPPMPQFRAEADHHRPRERPSSARMRRDERDAHPGPVPQDLPRDRHHLIPPDARGGMPPSPSQVMYTRPDQLGPGPPGLDQLEFQPPSVYPYGLPFSTGQLGMMPPGMDEQGLVLPGMGQQDVVPLWVPGMGQQGLELPSTAQPIMIPPSTQQYGVRFPGPDQRAMERPAMEESGVRPVGIDQRGFPIYGMDQQAMVPPFKDQQGFVQPGSESPGFIQPGTPQYDVLPPGAIRPGLVPLGMDQPGLVPPGAAWFSPTWCRAAWFSPTWCRSAWFSPTWCRSAWFSPTWCRSAWFSPTWCRQPGLVPPGAGQPGLVPPGAGQPGLVPPGAGQPGLVPPGAGQPGLVPPGAGQPGLVPPGAGQPGLIQPGVDQRGLVQTGKYPPGFVQPGAYPYSLAQPGVYPPWCGRSAWFSPTWCRSAWFDPTWCRSTWFSPTWCRSTWFSPTWCRSTWFSQTWYSMVWSNLEWISVVQSNLMQVNLVWSNLELISVTWYSQVHIHLVLYSQGHIHLVVEPRVDQHGLRQPDADHQGLVPPGAEPRGFPHRYQHGVAPPGRDQHGQVSPRLSRQGWMSPGMDQEGLAPTDTYPRAIDQRGPIPFITGTTTSPDVPWARSLDSINVSRQVSREASFIEPKKPDSLEKVAPSFPIAVETFRLMGELIGLYSELKENMKTLDVQKAGESDLEKIQYLLALMVQKTIPPDLQEQLKSIKTLTKEVRQEKAKLDKIQRFLEGEGFPEMGKEVAAGPLGLQLGLLRVSVHDIEKELSDLRESQEQGKVNMEHSVSEASLYLQDQLDKLRTIIENMLASSSTLLTMSMTPQKASVSLSPGQIDPKATCPACSLDLSHQVSTLVQRYEQLQHMVTSLAASRPSKKAKLQRQDEELLGHVQSAILQVQGDCEKLNIITGNLIEDHRQKQKDIDVSAAGAGGAGRGGGSAGPQPPLPFRSLLLTLPSASQVLYQGLEKLEKEKANRGHLEMEIEVKADKSALEAKVSRMQFDATTEQLNHMMQELVAKMSGQERDWQKMLDRLLTEMDSKLDRLELDPVKQLLEDRWKSLRQQLKERSPLYQADEAAGMRRQLLAHFHCLSCDRPLETAVTGQVLPTTPVGPSLPGHRSTRPYTVFELEQVRQQSRNLKLGNSAFPRADLASMERSVGRLRTMHSKMLMDIEKVQIHYGARQGQQPDDPRAAAGQVSEMSDYSFATVSRHCGGSHTLTYPYRRSRLQHLQQGLFPEDIQIARKHHEVDILGLDGHIYKGRMDTRLPGIPNKDSAGNNKHKIKPSRSHTHRQPALGDSSQLPLRPQSAHMAAGSTSATSRQHTDRPVSSEGRLSQPNVAHLPSPSGMAMHMDVPPGEGMEEPTRGPRTPTAR